MPQEMWDEIINHLSSDISSLAACSLVASSWLSICRAHLFNTLNITLQPSSSNRLLLQLLGAKYGTISRHVRRLQCLGNLDSIRWNPLIDALSSTDPNDTKTLQSLRLEGYRPSTICLNRWLYSFTGIHQLDLIDFDISTASLAQSLSMLPILQGVSVDIGIRDEDTELPSEIHRLSSSLRFIGIHCNCEHLCEWIAKQKLPLTRLYLRNITPDEYHAITSLLTSIAETLVEVDIINTYLVECGASAVLPSVSYQSKDS